MSQYLLGSSSAVDGQVIGRKERPVPVYIMYSDVLKDADVHNYVYLTLRTRPPRAQVTRCVRSAKYV